jgi:hypothetical protein
MKAMEDDSSMEYQSIAGEFKELRERLVALDKRFNPEKLNLHFGAPRTSTVWSGLWEEIDQLAREGLKKVNEHRDYFLENGMYDDGGYWYELFLLVHGAGVAQSHGQGPAELPSLETQRSILSCLVDISEYGVVLSLEISTCATARR